MSYQDGWAALNLEMPDRVPRTEYSVDGYHFALMRRVTGIPVTAESPAQERLRAAQAFRLLAEELADKRALAHAAGQPDLQGVLHQHGPCELCRRRQRL